MTKSALFAKIALTLLLLPALVWLAKVGIADFLRLEPCAYIDAVQTGVARVDPIELDKARARLQLARSWDNENSIIPEYQAQTDFLLVRILTFAPLMQADYLRKAIANLDAAIALRPNSAFLWAARMTAGSWLLDISVQQGILVDQNELRFIASALRRSSALDPWNPLILKQIVRVGVSHYSEFDLKNRLVVDGAVGRAKRLNVVFQ